MKAGVSYTRYSWGRLNDGGSEAEKLRAARKELGNAKEFVIVQPMGTYTIEKLEADIERHRAGCRLHRWLLPDAGYGDKEVRW